MQSPNSPSQTYVSSHCTHHSSIKYHHLSSYLNPIRIHPLLDHSSETNCPKFRHSQNSSLSSALINGGSSSATPAPSSSPAWPWGQDPIPRPVHWPGPRSHNWPSCWRNPASACWSHTHGHHHWGSVGHPTLHHLQPGSCPGYLCHWPGCYRISNFGRFWTDCTLVSVLGHQLPPEGHGVGAGAAGPDEEAHGGYGGVCGTEDQGGQPRHPE